MFSSMAWKENIKDYNYSLVTLLGVDYVLRIVLFWNEEGAAHFDSCSSNSLPVMLLTLADKKYFDSFFKNQNWFKKALDLKDTDSLLNNDYAVNMSNI